MKATATLRYLRIAPRKVRLVADVVRGKGVPEALTILRFARKKAAGPLRKLVQSAVANAKQQQPDGKEEQWKIGKIVVDEGPKLRRYLPRARGQVSELQKKMSHITIVLEEK